MTARRRPGDAPASGSAGAAAGQAAGGVPALAYSADSGPGWSVEAFGPRVGTFLCEATYTRPDEGFAGHLSGRQAGAMAAAAEVGSWC